MNVEHTKQMRRALKKFPKEIREVFYKQVEYLVRDLRHPSLHAKKYDETSGVWQARVNKSVRFYFQIIGDTYCLMDVRKHSD